MINALVHNGIPYRDGEAQRMSAVDVEEIATALTDQTDYEHRWLIDARTGQVAFWTSDTGIDGENPIENVLSGPGLSPCGEPCRSTRTRAQDAVRHSNRFRAPCGQSQP